MTVHAWLLVQAEVGRAREVCDALREMRRDGLVVTMADTVTGRHDIIARIEAEDADVLGDATSAMLAQIGGVEDVVTCIKLG